MKLHHKIIYMPVFVMLTIFLVSLFGAEYYLKSALEKRFEQELRVLSSFVLSATEPFKQNFKINSVNNKFDLLADHIAQSTSARISYFSSEGKLLGDSQMNFADVLSTENYSDHAEIIAALARKTGIAKRYDSLLKHEALYVASYDESTGLIARVSLPTNIDKSTIVNLRWGFTFIILVIIAVIIIFGVMSIRLINRAVQKEKSLLELRVIARTREITLIQTMSTMLNGSHSTEDAARVLRNIIPKLLPSLSGAIFLKFDEDDDIKELTYWGEDWPSNITLLATGCWRKKFSGISLQTAVCNQDECQLPANIICVSLVGDGELLGVMHLVSSDGQIDENYRNIAMHLAEQISYGLSNLRLKDKLRNQAIRDPLTNLYNRRFMLESFEQALNRAERHHGNVAILMIDLDFFKQFNDNYGHEAGDMVLTQVADLFKSNLRLEDIACRYGGEEFCIICPDTSLREAFQLAEKLRECVGKLTIAYRSQDLGKITISTGIAIFPNHGASIHGLINQADKALYEAKNTGRNCTIVSNANKPFPRQLS